MARYPGARWDPLPENATQSRIAPTQVILHTAVDAPGPTRLRSYFAREDVGVESHFWITLSGEVVQMMDTEVRADANRYANRRPDGTGAISIETEDEGDPLGVPWTSAQLEALEKVIRWASAEHDIPLRACQSPSDPGLGYHAQWGAPSAWTPSSGKTCPGATRIRQYETYLLPRLKEAAMAEMTNDKAKELSGALYEAFLLRDPDPAGLDYWTGVGEKRGALALLVGFITGARREIRLARSASATEAASLRALSETMRGDLRDLSVQVAALRADVDALRAALDSFPPLPSAPPEVDVEAVTSAVLERIIYRLSAD